MGHNREWRAQHLPHTGREDHRIDRACEDVGLPTVSQDETFAVVLQAFMLRHTALKGVMTSLVLAYASPLRRFSAATESKGFVPLTRSTEDKLLIPDGYQYDVIMRLGKRVLPGTPAFDSRAQQPAIQPRQFGYTADFSGFLPLPAGSAKSECGLLVVNHEYTNPELIFVGWDGEDEGLRRMMVDIEPVAHSLFMIEVQCAVEGGWSYVQRSSVNRRPTAETSIALSGPAAAAEDIIRSEGDSCARNFE
jgi:uncharacterized protein